MPLLWLRPELFAPLLRLESIIPVAKETIVSKAKRAGISDKTTRQRKIAV